MGDPIRLFVMTDSNGTTVTDATVLASIGLTTEEQIREAFGTSGVWREVWLREPTFGRQQEIRRRCQVRGEEGQTVYEATREPSARCAVMVERWNSFPTAPSEEAFEALPATVANALDQAIQAAMYPSLATNAHFMKAWRAWQAASAPESPASS